MAGRQRTDKGSRAIAPASNSGGPRRGLLLGSSINTQPAPPPHHILAEEIRIDDLPLHHLPKRHVKFFDFFEGISSLVLSGKGKADSQTLANIYDALLLMIQSVSPRSQAMIDELSLSNPAFRRHCAKFADEGGLKKRVKHPYDLLSVCKLIPSLVGKAYGEKYILERYASAILVSYIKKLRENPLQSGFMFAKEAIEYFQEAHKLEKGLSKISDLREKIDVMNTIIRGYYHTKWYYYFSVIAREPPINDGKLFMCAYHSAHFISMVRDDGELHNKPKASLLPKRHEIAFYLRRDRSVSDRIAKDADFAKKVADVLASLPG